MDFQLSPLAYSYRPLKLTTDPRQSGWDVFGLQTGLIAEGASLRADGIYGERTRDQVTAFQRERKIGVVDGIAGIQTQSKLCAVIARRATDERKFPAGIPYGHLEKESGCLFGNHTRPYPDGQRDCGVTQRNTNFATRLEAFDAVDSLDVLCDKIATKHDEYRREGNADRRAWELACGSWNAPAWTDALAEGRTLAEWQRDWIEAYIDRVTAYCNWKES